jgi:uncharacterized protein YdeI (BOF family)
MTVTVAATTDADPPTHAQGMTQLHAQLAAVPSCSPNDERGDTSGRFKRCIDHRELSARNRILPGPGCLDNLPPPGSIYTPKQCGGTRSGVEAIAQARAITAVSLFRDGYSTPRHISPNVHWEVRVGSGRSAGRADIVYYDRHNTTFIDVIEAKVHGNGTPESWHQQNDSYIAALHGLGMTNPRRGTVLVEMDYWDQFRVLDANVSNGCSNLPEMGVIRTYTVTAPEPGILVAKEDKDERACADGTNVDLSGIAEIDETSVLEDVATFLDMLSGRPRNSSKVYGEPHLITVDGLHYDLQSVGEFWLAESDRFDMQVQARFVARRDNVSIIDRVALWVSDHVVEIGGDGLLVDGAPVTLESGQLLDLGYDAGVIRMAGTYYVVWQGLDGPYLTWDGSCCHVGVHVPTDTSDMVGLLGNADGNPGNDLRMRDGTQLSPDTPANVLHGAFADSWRIDDDSTLFTYGPGQSTATYADLTFPEEIVTLHDLGPDQMSLATDFCESHGVPPGPQFNACILDMALTANSDFAAMAAQQTNVTLDPLAATVDTDGDMTVDFEADPLPQNVAPAVVTTDTATTAFAGPFSGTGSYRLYAQSLPPHVQGTLSFDLLAIGDWNSDADTETVTVRTDRANPYVVTPGALTPTRSGTLQGGLPYRAYRVSVPFDHATSQIELAWSATNVDALADQGFGVDNLLLDIAVVPPQSFATTLPLAVSDGVPAAGAGNLENAVARDEYRFAVPAGGSIYVDVRSCPGSAYLRWRLLDAGDGTVTSGMCADGRVDNLPPGDYRLVVDPYAERTGTYALGVFVVPQPQVFDVTLPLSVSDGTPAAGAGNLETKASTDEYRFTVPAGGAVYLDMQSCPSLLFLNWTLLTSTGTEVDSGQCTDRRIDGLTPGTYHLTVTPLAERTGPYRLAVIGVPPPQVFDVTLPLSVFDGVPAAGAGNLETKASTDEYRFTVPAGESIYVDIQSCLGGSQFLSWSLLDAAGARIESGGCRDALVNNLPAGSYRLVTSASMEKTGAYQLDVIAAPQPQVFDVTLPLSVSDGTPAAGAGNLETKASTDEYRFTMPAGGSLYVDIQTCPGSAFLAWDLLNAAGQEVRSGSCSDRQIDELPAGSYRLVVYPQADRTGAYALGVFVVPQPQVFNVTLPLTISDGAPATGAGNLETKASKDEYRFTIPNDGSLYVDVQACPGSALLNWRLLDVSGAVMDSGLCTDRQVDNLPAGDYRLVVSPANERTGTYRIAVFEVPPPQVFDVTLPLTVSDGVPAAGAGNLETTASTDEYRFTVPDGGSIYIDVQACPGSAFLRWSVLNPAGAEVASGGCADAELGDLPAGTYRLLVSPMLERTGGYRLEVFAVPTVQVFDVMLPVSISDGIPAAGAGNLETKASKDEYRFTLPADGSVYVDVQSCPGSAFLAWELLDSAGAEVRSGACSDRQVGGLAAGDYRLLVAPSPVLGRAGTYRIAVFVVPQPQVFNVTLPLSISDGVPATGAGNLETKASIDEYRFAAPANGSVYVDVQTCPGSAFLAWELLDSAGAEVDSGACNDRQIDDLPTGDYRLVVSPAGERTGIYRIVVFEVPQPQMFDVTLPMSVSDGVPAAGAGNLETKASIDEYRFTAPAGGSIYIDVQACPGSAFLAWSLLTATGTQVDSGQCSDRQIDGLAAGTYHLVITPLAERTGPYRLAVSAAPGPETVWREPGARAIPSWPLSKATGVPSTAK